MLMTILAALGSISCGVLFNMPARKLLAAGILGAVSYLTYYYMNATTGATIVSIFTGAFIMGITSEFFAIVLKSPSTVFSIVGAIPLVPGFAAYNTASLIIEMKYLDATMKGVYTIACAGSIALGIMLATSFFKIYREARQKFS